MQISYPPTPVILRQHQDIKIGRLMSPDDVALATQHHPQTVRERLHGKWFICGDMPELMYQFLYENGVRALATHLSVMASIQGNNYIVMSEQVDDLQHHFLVPLCHPDALPFIEAMRKGNGAASLANDGADDAIVLLLDPDDAAALPPSGELTALSSAPRAMKGIAEELFVIAAQLLEESHLMRDKPAPLVTTVTIVPSEEMLVALNARFITTPSESASTRH